VVPGTPVGPPKPPSRPSVPHSGPKVEEVFENELVPFISQPSLSEEQKRVTEEIGKLSQKLRSYINRLYAMKSGELEYSKRSFNMTINTIGSILERLEQLGVPSHILDRVDQEVEAIGEVRPVVEVAKESLPVLINELRAYQQGLIVLTREEFDNLVNEIQKYKNDLTMSGVPLIGYELTEEDLDSDPRSLIREANEDQFDLDIFNDALVRRVEESTNILENSQEHLELDEDDLKDLVYTLEEDSHTLNVLPCISNILSVIEDEPPKKPSGVIKSRKHLLMLINSMLRINTIRQYLILIINVKKKSVNKKLNSGIVISVIKQLLLDSKCIFENQPLVSMLTEISRALSNIDFSTTTFTNLFDTIQKYTDEQLDAYILIS